ARVADEADRLTRLDAVAALQAVRVRDAGDALAAVVIREREVVVEVDVEVRRPAGAVEVEHAAGPRRGRPELDRARLDRDRERPLRREEVVPLVAAVPPQIAEVVRVGDLADDGEDELRRRPLAVAGGGRAGRRRGGENE